MSESNYPPETPENIKLFTDQNEFGSVVSTNVQKMVANIYGWELYRVYRDEHKKIIKIELVKDNIVREFTFDGEKKINDGQ